MFDDERLEDGITLKVYRFESYAEKGKRLLSFVIRMQGPACDIGNVVISPMIQRRKEKCNADLADYTAANAPKRLPKLLGRFFKPSQADKEVQLKGARLQAQAGNPMMDFDLLAGEALLAEMKQQLEEKGLKLKSETRKSNGELDEQILHFA